MELRIKEGHRCHCVLCRWNGRSQQRDGVSRHNKLWRREACTFSSPIAASFEAARQHVFTRTRVSTNQTPTAAKHQRVMATEGRICESCLRFCPFCCCFVLNGLNAAFQNRASLTLRCHPCWITAYTLRLHRPAPTARSLSCFHPQINTHVRTHPNVRTQRTCSNQTQFACVF